MRLLVYFNVGILSILLWAVSFCASLKHFISYKEKMDCNEIEIDTRLEERLTRSRQNIEAQISKTRDYIFEHVDHRNRAIKHIAAALITGATFGAVKYINEQDQADLNKVILVLSQALYGYGYAGYQLNQIKEKPNVTCGIEDFTRVLHKYEDMKHSSILEKETMPLKRHSDFVDALWCMLKFQHNIGYHSPLIKARELFGLLDQHRVLSEELLDQNDTKDMQKPKEFMDSIEYKKLKKKLEEKTANLSKSLDARINEGIEIANSDKDNVLNSLGGSIVYGSLLEILGNILPRQNGKDSLRTEFTDIANYGYMGFYGLGFGWPAIVEGSNSPGFSQRCEIDKSPVAQLMQVFKLDQGISSLLQKLEAWQIRSIIQEFKRVLKIALACLEGHLGETKSIGLIEVELDKLIHNLKLSLELETRFEEEANLTIVTN